MTERGIGYEREKHWMEGLSQKSQMNEEIAQVSSGMCLGKGQRGTDPLLPEEGRMIFRR